MQTFLAYADFDQSAKVLDMKRLGKQRVESLQILKALTDPSYGWQNHPAVKMWRGYEHCLAEYSIAICDEWIDRGYKDTCRGKIIQQIMKVPFSSKRPHWLKDERVYSSHRSNLLRKLPSWYEQFGWAEPDDLEYFWPV